MSAITGQATNNFANPESKSNKDATKQGKGGAIPSRGLLTPEGTPEVDVGRTQADSLRRQQEAGDSGNGGDTFAITRVQPPNDDDKDDLIQEVLQCGKDEHRKVLGLADRYSDSSEEEEAIQLALWNRGTDLHPKETKGENAEKAFESRQSVVLFLY
jgi:hypothetical protein